jgi:hypothetical protein
LRGLKDEIRFSLRLLNPTNLNVAFSMAKIQEECVFNARKPKRFSYFSNSNWQNTRSPMSVPAKLERGFKYENYATMVQKSSILVHKLTSTQMEERIKKGLCYTCDEKWNRNHVCVKGKIYVLESYNLFSEQCEEETCLDPDYELEELDKGCKEEPEISLHAITGSPNPKTMRLWGKINYQGVIILIDFKSSHNFLDTAISSKLALSVQQVDNIAVKVANG